MRRGSAERGSSSKIGGRRGGGVGGAKMSDSGWSLAGLHVKMGTVDVPRVLVWLVKRFGGSGWKRGLG